MCKNRQTKKALAPLACRVRSTHPQLTSCLIRTTDKKDKDRSHVNCMAKKTPVVSSRERQNPKREPKFHQYEIEAGDGSVARVFVARIH